MKFEFIKKVEGEVNTYEGKMVKTGDVVEFSEVFAQKALSRPDEYRAIESEPKKRGPKVKVGNQG